MQKPAFLCVLALSLLGQSVSAADLFGRVSEGEVMRQQILGRMTRVAFPSPALSETRTIYVYTPPGYGSNPAKTYPVLVLLHGIPGGPLDWAGRGDCNRRFEAAIATGKVPASILVFPDGHGPFWKGGSEWADDISGRCKMETSITSDLPRFLKSRWHVSSDPNQWSLGGLSEGGYGAANLVVRHPDVYRNALVFSGDLQVKDSWGDDEKIFGTNAALRAANSPLTAIHSVPVDQCRKLRFYVAIGADDDEDLQTEGAAFVQAARLRGADGRFVREPGRHAWDFWSIQFSASLSYLGKWLAESR